MKKLIVIVLLFITIQVNAQDKPKFNDTELTLTEQTKFPNAKMYTDKDGNEYLNVTFKVIKEGILIGEKGTPLADWLLFPTNKINLTQKDLEDIFIFINYRDLKNRLSK